MKRGAAFAGRARSYREAEASSVREGCPPTSMWEWALPAKGALPYIRLNRKASIFISLFVAFATTPVEWRFGAVTSCRMAAMPRVHQSLQFPIARPFCAERSLTGDSDVR